jgi:hypothetical protein
MVSRGTRLLRPGPFLFLIRCRHERSGNFARPPLDFLFRQFFRHSGILARKAGGRVARRLPARLSLSWGCNTNQGANLMSDDHNLIEQLTRMSVQITALRDVVA